MAGFTFGAAVSYTVVGNGVRIAGSSTGFSARATNGNDEGFFKIGDKVSFTPSGRDFSGIYIGTYDFGGGRKFPVLQPDSGRLVLAYDRGNAPFPFNVQNIIMEDYPPTAEGVTDYTIANNFTGDAGNNYLAGGAGNDTLSGLGGNDTLKGGADNDELTGGEGSDSLDGGAGNDTFIFAAGHGNDTITDFTDGDKISLEGVTDFDAEVTITDAGADATVSWSGGTILIKDEEDHTDITARDFGLGPRLNGTEDAETLTGTAERELISGLGGDDTLDGKGGDDTLEGGVGDDVLKGGAGRDILDGGSGDDTASYADAGDAVTVSLITGRGTGSDAEGDTLAGIENLIGSAHGDVLTGDKQANQILGGDGHDTIHGGTGNDFLDGGANNDVLDGGIGNDTLWGGDNDDTIHGGTGNDFLDGGRGDDTFMFSNDNGHDTINNFEDGTDGIRLDGVFDFSAQVTIEDAGDDAIITWKGGTVTVENINRSSLTFVDFGLPEETILGDENDNRNDTLAGDGKAELIRGLSGNDSLSGGAGNDIIKGGSGGDTLNGDAGDDVLDGWRGNDTLNGGEGDDLLYGSRGNDILLGGNGEGNDSLYGGSGNDSLDGEAGNDSLAGGMGNDELVGGAGNDTLKGWTGTDMMTGGAGADLFVFNARFHKGGNTGFDSDIIIDFEDGVDKIKITSGLRVTKDNFGVHLEISDAGGETGNDTEIIWNDGKLTLQNFDHALLTADDFIFG